MSNNIEHLIIKFITGIISDEELSTLNIWRSKSVKNETLFKRLISMENFKHNVDKFVVDDKQLEREWGIIQQQINKNGTKQKFAFRYFKYAAAILFILGIFSGALFYNYNSAKFNSKQYAAEQTLAAINYNGSKATLILPEGNIITLGNGVHKNMKVLDNTVITELGHSIRYDNMSDIQKCDTVYHTLVIPRGSDYSVVLSDGTKVFLNSESELKYPVSFSKKERKVLVKGEAFFDVSKDKNRPFIVEIGDVNITVLGTKFGTRSYSDEKHIYTTLVSGSVSLEGSLKHTILSPGQQAVLNRDNNEMTIKEVNTELYTSWKDGRIVFDSTPLEQIMKYLSRIYSVDIQFNNDSLKDICFSINISKYDSFLQVKRLLEKTNKVSFGLSDNNGHNTIIVK